RVVPTLHRLKGNVRPIPIIEDVAVPPQTLPDFLVRLQNILKRHQITASLYAHAGHGQLHVRPFLDLSIAEEVRKMKDLADELYADVFDVGGTISGEHGAGLSRTSFVQRQAGPLYEVFRQVKQIFDPANIFNPGKIVAEEPAAPGQNLRPVARPSAIVLVADTEVTSAHPENGPGQSENGQPRGGCREAPAVEPQFDWSEQEFIDETRRCNGCAACRSQLADVRMCPIFRVLPAEEASPRAKANLLRAVLDGGLDRQILAHDEFKDVADLCVNCHQCRI